MPTKLNVTVSDEIAERLRRYAVLTTKKMRGTSAIVEQALIEYLDKVEKEAESSKPKSPK